MNKQEIMARISGHVITSALIMIAVNVAVIIVLLPAKEHNYLFFLSLVMGLFSSLIFIISIVTGCTGISKLDKDTTSPIWFSHQTGLCYLGIIFFFFGLLAGMFA